MGEGVCACPAPARADSRARWIAGASRIAGAAGFAPDEDAGVFGGVAEGVAEGVVEGAVGRPGHGEHRSAAGSLRSQAVARKRSTSPSASRSASTSSRTSIRRPSGRSNGNSRRQGRPSKKCWATKSTTSSSRPARSRNCVTGLPSVSASGIPVNCSNAAFAHSTTPARLPRTVARSSTSRPKAVA